MPSTESVNKESRRTQSEFMCIDLKITALYCGAADTSTVCAIYDKKYSYAADFHSGVPSS